MPVNPDDAAELQMDGLLGIRTTGRDESHADQDNNPYEPTPYAVLDRLVSSGLIGKRNVVVDYGCGKGRVGFYLSYQLRCHSIGVERDEWLYVAALRNQEKAASRKRTEFVQVDATVYDPPAQADRFYFFNPFSVAVFLQALARIELSLVVQPREALIVLYYPAADYVRVLDASEDWEQVGRINCGDLFAGDDPRECVLAYRHR